MQNFEINTKLMFPADINYDSCNFILHFYLGCSACPGFEANSDTCSLSLTWVGLCACVAKNPFKPPSIHVSGTTHSTSLSVIFFLFYILHFAR